MRMDKISKLQNAVGVDTVKELEAASVEELKSRITAAQGAIRLAKEELEANEAYHGAKENLKALSEGYREVRSRQNKITEYSLILLEAMGK